jgi:capsular exopolysaccharide synthesis family protein
MADIQATLPVAQRDEQIRQLREERTVAVARFGESHRFVTEVDHRILAAEEEKKREVERLLRERQAVLLEQSKKAVDGIESQLIGLHANLDESGKRLRDLSVQLDEYHQIKQKADTAEERYNKLNDVLNSARVLTVRPDNAPVELVSSPTDPALTFPEPEVVIPFTAVLLIAIVVGGVFLKETLDQRIKSPEDLKQIQGCELLGMLPDAAEDPSGQTRMEGAVEYNPTGLMAECFRQIRASLLAQVERRGLRTILFVGAQAQAGTSVVVSNLAVSLAANGKKVLLIDANCRRPSQHRLFNAPEAPGLAEVIAGVTPLEQAIFNAQSAKIDLLVAGSKDRISPDLFDRQAFLDLLRRLEPRYDVILLDAPPAILTSEASILIKHVDGVVLVVRAMTDMRGMIARLANQFAGRKAVVLGAILNRVWSSVGGYFRKNYKEYYRYAEDTQKNSLDLTAKASSLESVAKQ